MIRSLEYRLLLWRLPAPYVLQSEDVGEPLGIGMGLVRGEDVGRRVSIESGQLDFVEEVCCAE